MAFDELNRVTTITHLGTTGETLTSLDYTLDATGRRTAINESTGRTSDYTYDALYRLTGETITDTEAGNHSAGFSYDAVSNRIADTVNGVSSTYTYDDNDRLISHGFDTFSYDDNGNTISEVVDGQTNSYGYDSQNRLTEANMGGVVQSMAYDPDGIRIQKSIGGVTTDYLTDSNRDYAQVLYERSAASELNYTFGTDLVGLDTGAEQFTYHTDALGSTRLLTNDAGSVADDVRYDAWGEVLTGGDIGENQYLYTGEQFDSGLGKTYLRARYYDAEVGRFSQMDVFSGWVHDPISRNRYVYANQSPIGNIDPSGNFSLSSISAGLRGASILARQVSANIVRSTVNSLSRSLSNFGKTAKNSLSPKKKTTKKGKNQDEEAEDLDQFYVMLEAVMGGGYHIQPKPGKPILGDTPRLVALYGDSVWSKREWKRKLNGGKKIIIVHWFRSDSGQNVEYKFTRRK